MKTEYENLKVSSPAPGHYIIDGLPSSHTQTEEGRLVHPMSVHIPPTLPSGLLLEIVKDRAGIAPDMGAAEVVARHEEEVSGGVKDSGNPLLETLIVGLLAEGPARIGDIAFKLQVEKDAIKALAGNGFEIGAAGWVKLKEGGEV